MLNHLLLEYGSFLREKSLIFSLSLQFLQFLHQLRNHPVVPFLLLDILIPLLYFLKFYLDVRDFLLQKFVLLAYLIAQLEPVLKKTENLVHVFWYLLVPAAYDLLIFQKLQFPVFIFKTNHLKNYFKLLLIPQYFNFNY